MLEGYRIGDLDPADAEAAAKREAARLAASDGGPYAHEKSRHPALRVVSATPFNAETPNALMMASPTTAGEVHFVRNHLPVPPVLDAIRAGKMEHKIEVDASAAGGRRESVSVAALRAKYKASAVRATSACPLCFFFVCACVCVRGC